jgi:hypothetical protein
MKRILTLDGGGIRGIFSLQILKRLEEMFRAENGRPDLVLADVIDMFAGTSTGAIIATYLSWGKSVAEIEEMYTKHGKEIFCLRNWLGRWRSKYRADTITKFFRSEFCEADGSAATLGSKQLRTKLLVVMRNATTGSPWPLTNNPNACFNDRTLDDCNLNIPLWQLLRASTAAPTFFPPAEILFGKQMFSFVDGGISPFGNPTLIAVLMATLAPYRLCWPVGRDQLHVISIGTGSIRPHLPKKLPENVDLLDQIKFAIPALIGSIAAEQDLICRVIGDCIFGEALDSEIGDLLGPNLLASSEQKFTYVRYNQAFDAPSLRSIGPTPLRADLDDLSLMPALRDIGKAYAEQNLRQEHLRPRAPNPDRAR